MLRDMGVAQTCQTAKTRAHRDKGHKGGSSLTEGPGTRAADLCQTRKDLCLEGL